MISVEECKNIEYEILSCHLEDLSVKERRKILGVSELIHWRADDQRSETNQAYYDYVKTVFEMTKNNFDWAEVGKRVVGGLEVGVSGGFEGDPLDLQFLKFAKKINKLILEQKSPTYKDSWRKRGLVGIYHNLCRKWDRIENIVETHGRGRELDPECVARLGKALVDAIADLGAYSIKTLTYFEFMDMYKEALQQWEEEHGLQDTESAPKRPEEPENIII